MDFPSSSSSSKSNSGEDDMADNTGEHVAGDNATKANNDQGESESNGSDAPAHTNQSMNGIPEFLAAVWKDSHDTVSLTIFPI